MNKYEKMLESVDTTLTPENAKMLVESPTALPLKSEQTYLTMAGTVDKFLNENTSAENVAGFNQLIQPMLRRMTPLLIANDICSVQPINGKTNQIMILSGTNVDGNEVGFGDPAATSATVAQTPESERYANSKGVSMSIGTLSVTAKESMLRSTFTAEVAQDMKLVFGLDAKKVLADFMTIELALQLDKEVISAYANNAHDAGVVTLVPKEHALNGRPAESDIIRKIEIEANAIALRARAGRGNIAIVSTTVLSAMQSTNSFNTYNDGADLVSSRVQAYVGTLKSGIKVYCDAFANDNSVIVLHKGEELRTGVIYSPFITWFSTAVSSTTFEEVIGLKSRHAITVHEADKYASKFVVDFTNTPEYGVVA